MNGVVSKNGIRRQTEKEMKERIANSFAESARKPEKKKRIMQNALNE